MELTLHKLSERFLITSSNNSITSNEKNKIEVNDPFLHITNADYSFHICIDRPAKQSVIGDNGIDYFLGNCKKVIAQQDQIDFSALSEKEQEIFSDRKFTLEDMRKCFFNGGYMKDENEWNHYIQSISKPKSWKIDGLWENNKFKITKIWN